MNHYIPKRLRLNHAKRRQQIRKHVRHIGRSIDFPGLDGLTSTADIEVRVKRRRRWTKEHDRRYVKRYPSVTGTIGGRSRARVYGWDPAKAGEDRTVYPLHLGSGVMVGPRAHRALLDYFEKKDGMAVPRKEAITTPAGSLFSMPLILMNDPIFDLLDQDHSGLLIADHRTIALPMIITDPYPKRHHPRG